MKSDDAPVFVLNPPSISPQEARDTRARAWKFIFNRYCEKAASTDGAENAKKEKK